MPVCGNRRTAQRQILLPSVAVCHKKQERITLYGMDVLKNWWSTNSKKEKTVQILVALLVFTYSAYINNASVSIAAGLATVCILYDCYQKKSFSGFRIARENWLGIAIFLGSVLLASLLLGDKPSIHMAFKYVYWTLPFLLAAYLGKLADIRYAAAAGGLLSVAVTSINVAYLNYLLLNGHKLVGPGGPVVGGRLGAFLSYPTHYAMLLACTFPLLLCFYADKKLRINPLVAAVSFFVTLLGLWSLWKTGSRGGMIALFAGGIFIFALFCYFQKQGRLFRNGLTVGAAVVAVVLLVGIQDGNRQGGDLARVRMWKASYAMWQDHKLLGVGLENWQKDYAGRYILKDEIKMEARQRYLDWKKAQQAAAAKKAAEAKKAAAQKAAAAKKATEQKKTVVQNAPAKKPATQKPAVQKPKLQLTPAQKAAAAKAAAQKAEAAKKAAAKKEADHIAVWQNAAIKIESSFDMPHNVIAWFFSATGIIGGTGYLLFVLYYVRLFYSKLKDNPKEWILYVGLWSFLAVTIHGLADAGITNKETARLIFLILGIALNLHYIKSESQSESADSVC